MPLARIRQTCLHGHLLTRVLLASGTVTGEEHGEVEGRGQEGHCTPSVDQAAPRLRGGKEAGQRPLCPQSFQINEHTANMITGLEWQHLTWV